MNLRF